MQGRTDHADQDGKDISLIACGLYYYRLADFYFFIRNEKGEAIFPFCENAEKRIILKSGLTAHLSRTNKWYNTKYSSYKNAALKLEDLMKKCLSVMIVLIMILSAACGGASSGTASGGNKPTEEAGENAGTEEEITEETADAPEVADAEIKNKEFYFLFDDFSLYKAKVLSSSSIKIEKWWRGSKGDDFDYEKDFAVGSMDDIGANFKWTDDSQTAFTVTMYDKDNPYWDDPSIACFSIKGYGENTDEFPEYTYLLNDFSYYKAYAVSDATIKIEKWYRGQSYEGTPFEHSSDVTVFSTEDNPYGFSWAGDGHMAFTLTMQDQTNTYFWEEPKTVAFTVKGNSIDNDNEGYPEYSYRFNDFSLYKAYMISDTVIKVENWYRTNSEEEPFVHSHDVCVINPEDGSTDFAWTDDEHVAFTVTLEDEEAEYWGGLSLCSFSIETE